MQQPLHHADEVPPTATPSTAPLGRTTLSALVDAAGQAQQSTKPITRASVVTITSLVGVISAVLVPTMVFVLQLPWQVAIGVVMIFIGVSIGWTQMSFITNPAPYVDERMYRALQLGEQGQSAASVNVVRKPNKLASIVIAAISLCIAVTGVLMMCSIVVRFHDLIIGAFAGVLMLVVIAVVIAPWWMSLLADLGTQRAKTANEALRADIATHLHDSVLQTLALIRLHAGEPQTVASLARMQERELRAWLYTGKSAMLHTSNSTEETQPETAQPETVQSGAAQSETVPADLASDNSENSSSQTLNPVRPQIIEGMPFEQAIEAIAAYVEDSRKQAIEVVTVGQATVNHAMLPILDAATEAMHNAAHYGSTPITVYAEAQPAADGMQLSIFVRDHGEGFDTEHLPEGHMGIRESIIGRMRRAGGEATIISKPQWGTEARLTLHVIE